MLDSPLNSYITFGFRRKYSTLFLSSVRLHGSAKNDDDRRHNQRRDGSAAMESRWWACFLQLFNQSIRAVFSEQTVTAVRPPDHHFSPLLVFFLEESLLPTFSFIHSLRCSIRVLNRTSPDQPSMCSSYNVYVRLFLLFHAHLSS